MERTSSQSSIHVDSQRSNSSSKIEKDPRLEPKLSQSERMINFVDRMVWKQTTSTMTKSANTNISTKMQKAVKSVENCFSDFKYTIKAHVKDTIENTGFMVLDHYREAIVQNTDRMNEKLKPMQDQLRSANEKLVLAKAEFQIMDTKLKAEQQINNSIKPGPAYLKKESEVNKLQNTVDKLKNQMQDITTSADSKTAKLKDSQNAVKDTIDSLIHSKSKKSRELGEKIEQLNVQVASHKSEISDLQKDIQHTLSMIASNKENPIGDELKQKETAITLEGLLKRQNEQLTTLQNNLQSLEHEIRKTQQGK